LPLTLWALFFLIQTGRGAGLEQITADECERVLNYLYDLSLTAPVRDQDDRGAALSAVIRQRDDGAREARIADRGGESHAAAASSEECRRRQTVSSSSTTRQHLPERLPAGAARQRPFTDLGEVYRGDEMFTTPQARGRAARQMRPLPVPGCLRRIARPRLRGEPVPSWDPIRCAPTSRDRTSKRR
jgi:hypothetical protein